MRSRLAATLGVLALAAASVLTACGGDDDAGGSAAPLRIGYQRYGSLSLLKARNEAPPGRPGRCSRAGRRSPRR